MLYRSCSLGDVGDVCLQYFVGLVVVEGLIVVVDLVVVCRSC